MTTYTVNDLPGLNCGTCGFRKCADLAARAQTDPGILKRCIYLSQDHVPAVQEPSQQVWYQPAMAAVTQTCAGCAAIPESNANLTSAPASVIAGSALPQSGHFRDSLGREYDFLLEHFPEEPGPREIILPHNPILTRELDVHVGDILIGRPLGMSCGCPITHCGVAMQVDARTGVIVWCVTGPLNPRQKGYKDLGYYIAEGYEGLVYQTQRDLKIGLRYFFQPQRCMLQWRHSGLLNFLNRIPDGYQVRVEGLWIG